MGVPDFQFDYRNPLEIARKLQFLSIKCAIDRARKKILPAIPASLRDLAVVLDTYEPTAQIYRGLVQANDAVALLFISDVMIAALNTAEEIYIDGTFKVILDYYYNWYIAEVNNYNYFDLINLM